MASTRAQQAGILQRAWQFLAGSGDPSAQAIEQVTSHGRLLGALGRVWAPVLMIAFSGGALVTLGGQALAENMLLLQQGHMPQWMDVLVLAVTVIFVVGMDLAMLRAAEAVRDARTRGASWKETFWEVLLIVVIGSVEALTFGVMVARVEHPATFTDWSLLLARSVVAPIIAVYLATKGPKPFGFRDMTQLMTIKMGGRLLTYVDSLDIATADMSQIMQGLILIQDLKPEYVARMERLVQTMGQLGPARSAEDEDALTRALFHLMIHGALPADVLEKHPELADLSLAHAAASRGGSRRDRPAKAPATNTEKHEEFLRMLGVSPANRPANKKGIWIRSSDVASLMVGTMRAESLRDLVSKAGGNAKDGTTYIAPIERIMQELSLRHLLSEAAHTAWTSLGLSLDNPIHIVSPMMATSAAMKPEIIGASA